MSDSENYTTDGDESIDFSDTSSYDAENNIVPYQFEPLNRDDLIEDDINRLDLHDGDDGNRIGNTNWCRCNSCIAMHTERESVCCRDVEQTNFKLDVFNEEAHDIECITDHPGFGTVCLDRYVLETAYYQYRQQYGVPQQEDNEQQRYVAYRQFVRWCWGYLGREVRVVLPSCAVQRIRAQFPSQQYEGFQDL
ncbi:P2RX7-like protein [Mya arenaria]|uniref:P2RX7-like protein n=1 Tax=Mya arenaria TaxID=6604 RepID=A0ABY7E528_MYAAR|nr:P2X purinoceptor 7-like [Mya arenaria]WAR05113.1 P2RX7-like protein [Mya arenaria]